MDPIAIASATLAAKCVIEGFAKEAGKSAWGALTKIYDAIRARLAGSEDSIEVLQRMETKPTSQGRITELAEVLDEYIKADSSFGEVLQRLVKEAGSHEETSSFVTQVMGDARVGKITNIGTVHGQVRF
jgi:flavin-dependent dehydrogenase